MWTPCNKAVVCCSYVVGPYEFSGGQLDGSLPLLDEYLSATVKSSVRRTRTDLFYVNSQGGVGQVEALLVSI